MLRIEFTPSRRLALGLAAMNLAALSAWLLLPLPMWGSVIGGGALLCSAWWSIARYAWLRRPSSVISMVGDAEGMAQITRRDGQTFEASVSGDSFVTPYLTLIHFKPLTGRRHLVMVTPDTIEPEIYRQLRVWLKWRAGKSSATDASGGWAARV